MMIKNNPCLHYKIKADQVHELQEEKCNVFHNIWGNLDWFVTCDQRNVTDYFKVNQEFQNGMWKIRRHFMYFQYNEME